jgi:hypothetical protein
MIAQTASGIIFWEYQRQRRNDLKKAAKEKAFEEANNEDKRVNICFQALMDGASVIVHASTLKSYSDILCTWTST